MPALYSWWAKYMFWASKNGFPFPPSPVNYRTKLIIGHRGSSANWPENTMLAFKKAEEEGAHGIELDVRTSSDGEFVVMHDPTVDRTTKESGSVNNFTLSQLENMDAGGWKGQEFEGLDDTKVPSLETVLDYFKGKEMFIFLHDADPNNDSNSLIDFFVGKGMLDQCIYFATPQRIESALSYHNNILTVNDGYRTDFENLLNLSTTQGWTAIGYDWSSITTEIVEEAHNSNMLFMATLILHSFESKTHEFIQKNVDWIMGDDCARMMAVYNSYGLTQAIPGEIN